MLVFLVVLNLILVILVINLWILLSRVHDEVDQLRRALTGAPPPQRATEADDDDPGAPDHAETKPSMPQAYNW